ncbi:hypothetical protein DENSPDRAFT_7068 [Dentipellis sp. KUC8613]|nr:hypothetical protein DENSPDRAFT_7068 [Dentipellis sp. KUC8613]
MIRSLAALTLPLGDGCCMYQAFPQRPMQAQLPAYEYYSRHAENPRYFAVMNQRCLTSMHSLRNDVGTLAMLRLATKHSSCRGCGILTTRHSCRAALRAGRPTAVGPQNNPGYWVPIFRAFNEAYGSEDHSNVTFESLLKVD